MVLPDWCPWWRQPGDMRRPRSARRAARRPNRSPMSRSQRNNPASAAVMSSSSRSVMTRSVLAVNPSSEIRATVDARTPYPTTRSSSSLGAFAGGSAGGGGGGGGGGGTAAGAGGPRSHRNGCAAKKASLGSMHDARRESSSLAFGAYASPFFLVFCLCRGRASQWHRGSPYKAATVVWLQHACMHPCKRLT